MSKIAPLDVVELEGIDGTAVDYEEKEVVDEEDEERENWGSQIDFILSCIGYAVGLGNILRFPYMAGKNGGAAFMIPYFTMMFLSGLPTFYLELAIGQYSQVTPYILYRRMCPVFTGIGYTMVAIAFLTGTYYNMELAWAIYYFVMCFKSVLPWSTCNLPYMSDNCFDDKEAAKCVNTTTPIYFKGLCYNTATLHTVTNLTASQVMEGTNGINATSPAADYLQYVLSISGGIDELGTPKWDLMVALVAAWILVILVLSKGVKSAGKVVYFTATFPYVLLAVLLVRGITLPGNGTAMGLHFYLVPNFTTGLFNPKVWGDAAGQIFFSLSVGGGGLTTLATYNKFNNNLLRDTLIVVFGNCATSVFAGFVIFPILGFIADHQGKTVAEVAADGVTLGFVSYPYALTRIPLPQLWCALFFFMLVILGIDSELVIVEVVITMVTDRFPKAHSTAWRKFGVVCGVCFVMFLAGIVLTCPGGVYIINLIDTFGGGYPLLFACLPEIVMVSWFYGIRRFIGDIEMMMGKAPNTFWRVMGYPSNILWWACWVIITPVLLTVILLYNFVSGLQTPFESAGKVYPIWANYMGWGITLGVVGFIPFWAVIFCMKAQMKHKSCGWLITPTDEWGPQGRKLRARINREHPMRHLWAYSNEGFENDDSRAYPGGYVADKQSARPVSYRSLYDGADAPPAYSKTQAQP